MIISRHLHLARAEPLSIRNGGAAQLPGELECIDPRPPGGLMYGIEEDPVAELLFEISVPSPAGQDGQVSGAERAELSHSEIFVRVQARGHSDVPAGGKSFVDLGA